MMQVTRVSLACITLFHHQPCTEHFCTLCLQLAVALSAIMVDMRLGVLYALAAVGESGMKGHMLHDAWCCDVDRAVCMWLPAYAAQLTTAASMPAPAHSRTR